jgi:hypothetical protein
MVVSVFGIMAYFLDLISESAIKINTASIIAVVT